MSDEQASDERPDLDLCTDFRVNCFYTIIDNAEQSINDRFVPNKDLYKDCAWFDPEKFAEISKMKSISEYPESTFVKISELTGLSRVSYWMS